MPPIATLSRFILLTRRLTHSLPLCPPSLPSPFVFLVKLRATRLLSLPARPPLPLEVKLQRLLLSLCGSRKLLGVQVVLVRRGQMVSRGSLPTLAVSSRNPLAFALFFHP